MQLTKALVGERGHRNRLNHEARRLVVQYLAGPHLQPLQRAAIPITAKSARGSSTLRYRPEGMSSLWMRWNRRGSPVRLPLTTPFRAS